MSMEYVRQRKNFNKKETKEDEFNLKTTDRVTTVTREEAKKVVNKVIKKKRDDDDYSKMILD